MEKQYCVVRMPLIGDNSDVFNNATIKTSYEDAYQVYSEYISEHEDFETPCPKREMPLRHILMFEIVEIWIINRPDYFSLS